MTTLRPPVVETGAPPEPAGRSGTAAERDLDRVDDALVREALASKLASLPPRLAGEATRAAVVALLLELNGVDATARLGLIARLATLLDRLPVAALRRWVVTGLRGCAEDRARLRAYFRLEDPLAERSLAFEAAGQGFEDLRESLQFYVDGLMGEPWPLQGRRLPALNGPPARSILTRAALLLPEGYSVLEGEASLRLYWAAVAHAVAHRRFSPLGQDPGTLKPMSIAVISLIEDARAEALMARTHPGLQRLWGRFHREEEGIALSFESLMRRLARALHEGRATDDHYWVDKGVKLFRARMAADPLDPRGFREIGSILANDLGQMRVRFVPDQYVPEPAYRDDNSVLWDFGEPSTPPPQAEELMVQGVRVERVETDVRPEESDEEPADAAQIVAASEAPILYPEWEYRTQTERRDWVSLYERPVPLGVTTAMAGELPATGGRQSVFALARSRQLSRAALRRRQWEGDQLHLDDAVTALVDLRSGVPPDPRIFVQPGREPPRPAVLVLLDLSESTNDRLPGRYDSVLDLAKRATRVLGEAIDRTAERFAVHGFSSNGRHEVEYFRVKDFDQPFDAAAARRLMALRGQHSTRMGAALRHAGALLAQEPLERKVVLLVTDGEPADVDVFDQRYLLEDAAAAVRALRGAGIRSFCLTLDPKSLAYADRIFGESFLLVTDPLELPQQLSKAFVRLLHA